MSNASGGNNLLQKLMADVIFQKVTLYLAQRLFSTDLYLFKGGVVVVSDNKCTDK